jgi:hypothetical protein
VQIRIVGTKLPGRDCGPGDNFPGYSNIHVGVQRKNRPDELLDVQPGDATRAVWTLDCSINAADVRGPYIQGPPGGRFIYLNWGGVTAAGQFTMFRRAKLMLSDVPADVLDSAAASGTLVGSLGLTDAKGHPLCARVRPPQIRWTTEASAE